MRQLDQLVFQLADRLERQRKTNFRFESVEIALKLKKSFPILHRDLTFVPQLVQREEIRLQKLVLLRILKRAIVLVVRSFDSYSKFLLDHLQLNEHFVILRHRLVFN